MNHIDLKYSGILSTRLDRFKVKSNNPYKANFRCPICGDSQKSKSKTRGWLLQKDNGFIYYCHNCSASMSLRKYLETHEPALYNEYIADLALEKQSLYKLQKKEEVKPLDKLTKSQPKFTKGKSPLLQIKKVSSLEPNHPVKKYVNSRMIPSKEHYRLYYAPKFNKWVNRIYPDKLDEKKDEPRLVLPFIDEKGQLFGFAGRSFDPKANLRYITIMLDETRRKIFGLDRVDFNRKYFVVEGQIDSLFLCNSIAMSGADGSDKGLINPENAVFVFDLEPRNKEIVQRMEKVIDRGYKIVILSEKYKSFGKDINELVLSGMKPVDIELILDQHTYSGLDAKLALTIWKRV